MRVGSSGAKWVSPNPRSSVIAHEVMCGYEAHRVSERFSGKVKENTRMTRFLLWSLMATVLVGVEPAMAAQFVVGSCKPNLTNFPTISAAVAAVPAGSTVLVCPGTYPEQVVITQPLTLQGIISGNSGRVTITVPGQAVGLPQLAVNSQSAVFASPVAGQVVVQNVNPLGAVNLSDITVDGNGGVVSCA